MLIDSHFHPVIMQEKGLNMTAIFSEMQRMDTKYAIAIATHPTEIQIIKNICNTQPYIYYASGIYPSFCTENYDIILEELENQLSTEKILAIGEIGLDYYHNYGTKEKQKKLFKKQLLLAEKHRKPVILHIRDSFEDVFICLKEAKLSSGGIAHCFSGNYKQAKTLLDMGFYISFAGNITYKNNTYLTDVLKKIPQDRILIETDSPFLSPLPVRGKPNTPLNTAYIMDFISDKLKIKRTSIETQIINNFKTLFKL
ncbi:TatD family hydrolase [Spirochaetia bacterium 38H-sp]|uniref:TatD family hydrolase n=1 Tax=Rarispira pelagica TaxID=3141764 RepID=A0ABU9UBG6_9SPIR